MVIRWLKIVGYVLASISILMLIYLLSALLLSMISTSPRDISCEEKKYAFIASNGIHLDIILPVESVNTDLLNQLNPPSWVAYLAFGWGDRKFYIDTPTWNDLRLGTALRALFTNSPSAVHVVWLKGRSSYWTEVPVCPEQMELLNQYIADTFVTGKQKSLSEIQAAGYSDNDRFYQASGNFSLFQTCNQWVNQGLKTAQVKTAIWSPFDKGVLYQVRRTKGIRAQRH